jgi:hypothetical protein
MNEINTSRDNEIGALWVKSLENSEKRIWGSIKIDGKEFRFKAAKNPFYKEPKHPLYRLYKDDYVPAAKTEKAPEVDL